MGVTCFLCDKVFSSRYNLHKHTKNVHNTDPKIFCSYDQSKWNYKCVEEGCNNSFRHNDGLIDHLKDVHSFVFETETLNFSNMEEFFAWKIEMEKSRNSNYIILRTNKTAQNSLVTYYSCNRSGKSRGRSSFNFSSTKRLPKVQGSCKINRYCTSIIKVIQGEQIFVTWIKTHYGHKCELQHLRLPKADKLTVASKLTLGVPPARILGAYRDQIGGDEPNRSDLITRKDIANIRNSLIKETKGKYTKHSSEIIKRHRAALESHFNTEQIESQNKWFLSSVTDSDDEIEPILTSKCENKPAPQHFKNKEDLKKRLCEKISETSLKLHNVDKDTLDNEVILQIESHLNAINKLLELPASNSQDFIPINNSEPVNKNITKQVSFFSTQKKRKRRNNKKINQDLKSNFTQPLFVSHSSINDHNYLLNPDPPSNT